MMDFSVKIDELFDDCFGPWISTGIKFEEAVQYRLDGCIEVRFLAAGVDPSTIGILVDDNSRSVAVMIPGVYQNPIKNKIPIGYDFSKITASCKRGILTVRIPKDLTPQTKPRKIEIVVE